MQMTINVLGDVVDAENASGVEMMGPLWVGHWKNGRMSWRYFEAHMQMIER